MLGEAGLKKYRKIKGGPQNFNFGAPAPPPPLDPLVRRYETHFQKSL